jgi:predicted secreted protein
MAAFRVTREAGRRIRRATAVVAATGALTVPALVSGATTATPAAASTPSGTVTVAAPTSTVDARVGDTVVVTMTACAASCGMQWVISTKANPAVVRYLYTTYREQGSSGLVGGYQTEIVRFRAVGPGSTSVTWKYLRPAAGEPPSGSYTLRFRVAARNGFGLAALTDRIVNRTSQAVLARIRVGNDGWFDRIVFDEVGSWSDVSVRYVPAVVADPSGLPVAVRGRYFLQIVLSNTVLAPGVAAVLTPQFPELVQVRRVGSFEHVVTFGAGVTSLRPFRVFRLTSPNRVVVDILH